MADMVNRHNYYLSNAQFRVSEDLRPVKPDIIHSMKEHKDIVYRGISHKAMYKGDELVWRRFVIAYQYGFTYSVNVKNPSPEFYIKANQDGNYYYYPKILYSNSLIQSYCEVGVFAVVEGCTLDEVIISPDSFEISCDVITPYYCDGRSRIGPDVQTNRLIVSEHFYYGKAYWVRNIPCEIKTSNPKGEIRLYFYMASRNEKTGRLECTYLVRLMPGMLPEIRMISDLQLLGSTVDVLLGISIEDNPTVDHFGTDQLARPMIKVNPVNYNHTFPFVTDIRNVNVTYAYLGKETVNYDFKYNHEHYLPYDTIKYLVEDFSDKRG